MDSERDSSYDNRHSSARTSARDHDRHRTSYRDRSASPSRHRRREEGRSNRSPPQGSSGAGLKRDPIAAAAAAAERINAQIQAKFSNLPAQPKSPSPGPDPGPGSSARVSEQNVSAGPKLAIDETTIEEGDYIRDIPINHIQNRYTLTKGQTQMMIKAETGADITTRGRYYPDSSQATEKDPPLYLHITAQSRDAVERAVVKINELVSQDAERRTRRQPESAGLAGPLSSDTQPYQSDPSQGGSQGAQGGAMRPYGGRPNDQRPGGYRGGRNRWLEDRVVIGLDYYPGFNVRGQIVGQGGQNVKHIQAETGCRVQIKGRGSQFIDQATGKEGEEPMYLHVIVLLIDNFSGPEQENLTRAVGLATDLVKTVTDDYNAFRINNPRNNGGRNNYNNYNNSGMNNRSNGGGMGSNNRGGFNNSRDDRPRMSAADREVAAAVAESSASQNPDYTAFYAAVAAGQDPYAAYGGYDAYVQYCQQYYAQYYAQMQQQQPGSQQLPASQADGPKSNDAAAPPAAGGSNRPPGM
ncbi:uncharacterized protein V1516DRAFT_645849 [Lipomyces oligophaga]|uniref:uncharacterized protein n=1 Tax=Lipomyces oligophaga TaxID=45792 RepID=UPI0034CFE54B